MYTIICHLCLNISEKQNKISHCTRNMKYHGSYNSWMKELDRVYPNFDKTLNILY